MMSQGWKKHQGELSAREAFAAPCACICSTTRMYYAVRAGPWSYLVLLSRTYCNSNAIVK